MVVEENKDNVEGDRSVDDSIYRVWSGDGMIRELNKMQILQHYTVFQLQTELRKLKTDFSEGDADESSAAALPLPMPNISAVQTVDKIVMFLKNCATNDYKMVLEMKKGNVTGFEGGDQCTLHLWCFFGGVGFHDAFLNCWSVILASGTLWPSESITGELGSDFRVSYTGPHIIKAENVVAAALLNGPGCCGLVCNADGLKQQLIQHELGKILLRLARIVTGGILMFFPSYSSLVSVTANWRKSGTFAEVESIKSTFVEPKGKAEFDIEMEKYLAATRKPQGGAIFLGIYRGKMAEGVDFCDCDARMVIAVGIPYASLNSLQVQLKVEYNNSFAESKGLMSGQQWYELNAFRALNQSLGRCLRHHGDWGAVVIVDERYRDFDKYKSMFPEWFTSSLCQYEHFNHLLSTVYDFFLKQ